MPWPPNAASATDSGTESGSGRAHARDGRTASGSAADRACRRAGCASPWAAPARAARAGWAGGAAASRPLETRARARSPTRRGRRRRRTRTPGSCRRSGGGSAPTTSSDFAGFERRASCRRRVAVGMVGVEVAARRTARPARGRRCAARRCWPGSRGACAANSAGAKFGRTMTSASSASSGSRLRASTSPSKRVESGSVCTSSVAPSASSAASVASRVSAARAAAGPFGGQVGEALAVARIGGRARARRDHDAHQGHRPVATRR